MRADVQAMFEQDLLPRNRDWRAWIDNNQGDPDWFAPLKAKARAQGLWNMGFTELPAGAEGTPLSNLDFAAVAEVMGRLPWAPGIFNCDAPNLPNMIMLADAANAEQQEQWLRPLLEGRMRSGFAMTEPDTASSDAKNIAFEITRTDTGYVLNGKKWFSTGAAHPDCGFVVLLGKMAGSGPRQGHTSLIVPMDTPGLIVARRVRYLGWEDPVAPTAELHFDNVEVPHSALLGAEGQGFAQAQTRLGPARVHHCMRLIGLAELALELMVARAAERQTFGQSLASYDTIQGWIAQSRIDIELARMITLKCAWLLDKHGHAGAWRDVSIAKVAVPRAVYGVTERALQVFGAMGGTDDTPLHAIHAWARGIRIGDGPDEVHLRQIFKQEAAPSGPLSDNPYIFPFQP